ncbi:MAG: response regulator, partial [Calditrichaeota bacterium]
MTVARFLVTLGVLKVINNLPKQLEFPNMENPIVLVADADPKNLQILSEGLESSGFTVLTATDGQEAWEKIYSERPDLVLSEVTLPKLDGFQLLERIKQEPTTASIPIMFLTNRREIQDRVRSLRGGV